MKVCLKENEFNPSFISLYGEEKAKEQGYIIVDVGERYDTAREDFDGFIFNIDKYNARKEKAKYIQYEFIVIGKIRKRYTIDQELAILRQRDVKPTEFAEYNAYVEQCKLEAKQEVSNGN